MPEQSVFPDAPTNDRNFDLVFITESFSGNEVGTVVFLPLPFH